MSYKVIDRDSQLQDYCQELAGASQICFDTEFVAEHTYRPVLCLIQVAAGNELAVIDTLAIRDLNPFWEVLANPTHETVVHAGRSEMEFCLDAIGRRPANLFDVQVAAALVGNEYPAGYGNLIGRFLGKTPAKGETRTDWRKRPLTSKQMDYALDDVRYLTPLRNALSEKLVAQGRAVWLTEEMESWQREVEEARTRERWRRVSGLSGFSSRELAIARELWRWREAEAQRRNWPVKRVLRDDLISELAKRRSADPKQIQALRGMDRGDLRTVLPKLEQSIAQALALPAEECPQPLRREANLPPSMLTQYLASALTAICRQAHVAASLVGTVDDLRELIHFCTGKQADDAQPVPLLKQGWRAQVVGNLLDDLIAGKVSIRIADPLSDQPLAFVVDGESR